MLSGGRSDVCSATGDGAGGGFDVRLGDACVHGRAGGGGGPFCGNTWGSQAKAAGDHGRAPLGKVRTGRHDCFDRVVFEIDGPAAGYRVEYVSEVRTEGEGAVLPLAGGAYLEVVLLANVFDELGHVHYNGPGRRPAQRRRATGPCGT